MAVDIDRLQIEIGATSSDAAAKIDNFFMYWRCTYGC
nr:MAG TPA: hypothetical protein [Caudoviricetes sp.]